MRAVHTLWATIGIALATAATAAPPPAEHQAGLDAYRRGDVRNAISFLRKSADAGHAPSQALLGEILDMAEQNDEAVRYFRLAADQGEAEGYYGLAVMHASGEGVARDLKAARAWMTRAAESGHRLAVQSLAAAYMQGGLGIDEAERASPAALAWIERAAALDSLAAIDRLAAAYRHGQLGLAPDAAKAEELEARARAIRRIVPAKGKAPKRTAKANG